MESSTYVSPKGFERSLDRNADSASLTQAYDGHMNMVLSDVEETIYVVDVAEVTGENVVRVSSSAGIRPGREADLLLDRQEELRDALRSRGRSRSEEHTSELQSH